MKEDLPFRTWRGRGEYAIYRSDDGCEVRVPVTFWREYPDGELIAFILSRDGMAEAKSFKNFVTFEGKHGRPSA
jgi:hypothetical protein